MSEFVSLRSAAAYANVSYQTIRNWLDDYDLGTFKDGRWTVEKDKLDRVLAARDHIAEIRSSLKHQSA